MKFNFKYLFVLSAIILVSCNQNNVSISNSESNSIPNSVEPSITPSVTSPSINVTSPSISLSITPPSVTSPSVVPSVTSPSVPTNNYTLKEIKDIALSYKNQVNIVGVYESNINVDIDLTLIACLDAVTSKTGYGDRYKLLMSDGFDYIYIKTTYSNYDYLKEYVNNRGLYNIKGTISLYNNEPEITVMDKITYLGEGSAIDYDNLAISSTIEEVYSSINQLKTNCKGIAFSKIVKLPLKCLAKDINNTNMYFGNGDYIINVHGNDKVTNKFTKDNSYIIYGALTMHNFRPGLEYVYHEVITEDVNIDFSNLESKTNANFYSYTYEVDEDESYPNYTSLFLHPYVIEGYLSLYQKDSRYYTVIDDNNKDEFYSTYQNARSAKTTFLVNENLVKISDISYHTYYDEIMDGSRIKAVVFPYLWNTNDYPQIYLYDIN